MTQEAVFEAIAKERDYQDAKWGDTDHLNNEYNWAGYIGAYANRSLIGTPGDDPARKAAFKKDMVKVAALAVAAIEKLGD